MPTASSSDATRIPSAGVASTISATACWRVLTCESWCTSSTFAASAATSSVDITHVPRPNTSTAWVATAATLRRHAGSTFTRLGAVSTTSTAEASGVGAALPSPAASPFEANVACTCSRSSLVSLARRTRSRSAIARVFRRAWPTGSP